MNRVLLLLGITAILALLFLPFVHFSPNRFSAGKPYNLYDLVDITIWIAIILPVIISINWQRIGIGKSIWLSVFFSGSLLLGLLALLAESSKNLVDSAGTAARVSIGGGFWLALLLLNLILLDCWQRLKSNHLVLVIWLLSLLGIIFWWFSQQQFEALSLVKEYRNQQLRFSSALVQHIRLVAFAFIPTLFIGLFSGWLVWRYPRLNSLLFAGLNFLQTIPSIALFSLLMLPLAWLAQHYALIQNFGISGIGATPAILALVLYTLLPLIRNTYAGFKSVPDITLETAAAMGMTKGQTLFYILIPLALPVILSGIRIVVVQSIGLTVIAALIGAGGLGIFVWEGLGQYALDMVLLGALPTIGLAVFADFILQGLIKLSQPIKVRD